MSNAIVTTALCCGLFALEHSNINPVLVGALSGLFGYAIAMTLNRILQKNER